MYFCVVYFTETVSCLPQSIYHQSSYLLASALDCLLLTLQLQTWGMGPTPAPGVNHNQSKILLEGDQFRDGHVINPRQQNLKEISAQQLLEKFFSLIKNGSWEAASLSLSDIIIFAFDAWNNCSHFATMSQHAKDGRQKYLENLRSWVSSLSY